MLYNIHFYLYYILATYDVYIICNIYYKALISPFLSHSGNNPYSSFGATLVREDEKNLWSVPRDVSHTEADDDRILYNLIVVRNQQAKDSEVSTF